MDPATTAPEDAAKEVVVRPATQADESLKVKPGPKSGEIPFEFAYSPSDDGTDENLLILLHGLGDTHVPFAKLGKSLKLPQTATLALRAPEKIPYLDEQAFQWYPTFDDLGEFLQNPNPTSAVDALVRTLEYLTDKCAWAGNRIHLFGFAQGGTVAAETGLRWWSLHRNTSQSSKASLATIVSISGPLLSYSTTASKCPTALVVFHRQPSDNSGLPATALAAFRKGYTDVREVKVAGGEGMPRSRDEWENVMRFWSERLSRRAPGGSGLYEVLTGV